MAAEKILTCGQRAVYNEMGFMKPFTFIYETHFIDLILRGVY